MLFERLRFFFSFFFFLIYLFFWRGEGVLKNEVKKVSEIICLNEKNLSKLGAGKKVQHFHMQTQGNQDSKEKRAC